jgi:tripartite ATP-independent transporter DctM subunit
MTSVDIGTIGIAVMLVLLMLRVPIGISLASVAIVGIFWLRGFDAALSILGSVPYDFISKWTLSAVPMFLLMGAIAAKSGITGALYSSIRAWVGWLPGGLAVATNFAGAGFAAICGSSLATTAAMGRTAVPEMLRLGYAPGLATGTAAAVGTLGALIPPSIMMVIYAVFAEASVGKMLVAGILPGLLTAAAYAALIIGRCTLQPSLAPRLPFNEISWGERFRALIPVWPLPIIVIGVVGGIYSGIMTATEAGAFGAFITAVVAYSQGRLSLGVLRDGLVETAHSTTMIFTVAIGAALFTTFLALSQLPGHLASGVVEHITNPIHIVLLAAAVYLVLGCFLDPLGILMLTLPIFLPVFKAAGIDPIWIGVILVKYLEIGLLTPPVGLNVFVMKGVMGDQISLGAIFKGVSWFLIAEAVVMTLLTLYPQIILFLPSFVQ